MSANPQFGLYGQPPPYQPQGQPHQPQGQPYQPQGQPYQPQGQPYQPQGQPYQPQGQMNPLQSQPQYAPQGPVKMLGVGGLPVAAPYFWGVEDEIRRGFHCGCCLDYNAGPNVPAHWYDGGRGWVTRYFTDVVPFNEATRENGRFRCQVPNCKYEVAGEGYCDGNCCYCPSDAAVDKMIAHASQHQGHPPPPRQWQSELCATEGCFDTLCCVPCQGSRQMMALAGHADTFNWWWCLAFTLLGCRSEGDRRNYWVPPWIFVAAFTRPRMATLNNIDEGCCTTCLIIFCCSPCSIAQTYRELKLSGVWTGKTCCNDPPTATSNFGAVPMA